MRFAAAGAALALALASPSAAQSPPKANFGAVNACVTPFAFMTSEEIADVQAGKLDRDVTAPLQKFMAAIETGGCYKIPKGLYKFSQCLAASPTAQHFSFLGEGRYNSQFVYAGAPDCNLLTFGDTSQAKNLFVKPESPATQNVPLEANKTYTLIFYGDGMSGKASIALSGVPLAEVKVSPKLTANPSGRGPPTYYTFKPTASGSLNVTLANASGVSMPYLFEGQPSTYNLVGAKIGGFMARSLKAMNAGTYNLYFVNLEESNVDDISCGGTSYITAAYNCAYFDGFHNASVNHFEFVAQHDGVTVRGGSASSDSDITFDDGFANLSGAAGVHIAGGAGGVYLDQMRTLGNHQRNLLIDDSATGALNFNCSTSGHALCPYSQGNREILLGVNFVSDGVLSTPVDVELNAPQSKNASLEDYGFVGSAVYRGAPNTGINILVTSWPNGLVDLHGRVFNANSNNKPCGESGAGIGDGLFKVDASARINASPGAHFDSNSCWAFDGSTQDAAGSAIAASVNNNGAGISPKFAAPAYTPKIACVAGSGVAVGPTNVQSASANGKQYCFRGKFTLASVGRGCTFLTVTLPFTAADVGAISGADLTAHTPLFAEVSGSTVVLGAANGGYPGNTSDLFSYSGCVEAQQN